MINNDSFEKSANMEKKGILGLLSLNYLFLRIHKTFTIEKQL